MFCMGSVRAIVTARELVSRIVLGFALSSSITPAVTEPEPLQQLERTYVCVRGRKLSYFSGCDYFRLASHPQVLRALHEGAKKFGLNVASSRLTTGNHVIYSLLEDALADFFSAPAALLLPNGYVTNQV